MRYMDSVSTELLSFTQEIAKQTLKLRSARALFTTTVMVLALKSARADATGASQENAKRLIRECVANMHGHKDGLQEQDVPVAVRQKAEQLLL